tara:strand:+ start:289 stop:603 length:315 start_codon:yes stop_codon:yes gene_type:complete
MPIPLAHFEPPKNKPYKSTKATMPASIVVAISPGKVIKAQASLTMPAVVTKFASNKNALHAQNGNTLYPRGLLATSCNAGKREDVETAAKIAHSLKPWNQTYTT